MNDDSDELQLLRGQVAQLTARMARMESAQNGLIEPYTQFPTLLAAVDSEADGTWHQQTVVGDELGDMPDGLTCTSGDDPSALIDPGQAVFLLPIRQKDAIRYVPFQGGKTPKGQYQGQDYTMRTNNTAGWDFDQFVPPLEGV